MKQNDTSYNYFRSKKKKNLLITDTKKIIRSFPNINLFIIFFFLKISFKELESRRVVIQFETNLKKINDKYNIQLYNNLLFQLNQGYE